MVFIEACLGPVRLVRSSSTRSSGQNWTPSTIQTPSRPGSRRTKSAGRKLAGEDPPWHRPLRAQTFTSCQNSQNPPNTQTTPIIISPSLEGGPPYDPPSLTGQNGWQARLAQGHGDIMRSPFLLSRDLIGQATVTHLLHADWSRAAARLLLELRPP